MDSHPSPSDVPVLHRALRPLAATGRRPLRRVGTVLRSTLSFGRGLGTGIVRREHASSPAGLAQVRVPDGAWHLPQVENAAPSGPVDTEMAALAASMRRYRSERPVQPVQRGVPIVSRRMGRTDAAGGVGPSGLSRRLRPAESAIPRNDSHGADRAANPRDDDPPGGTRRPTPSRPPTGPPPVARRSASASPSASAPLPSAQQARTQASRSGSARARPSRGADSLAGPSASPMPARFPQTPNEPAFQQRVQRTSTVPATSVSHTSAQPTRQGSASVQPQTMSATPTTNGSSPVRDADPSRGDARREPPTTELSPINQPAQLAPVNDPRSTSQLASPQPTMTPAAQVGELAMRQRSRPLSPIPAAVSRSSQTASSQVFSSTPGQRLSRRLITALPTPSQPSRDEVSREIGGVSVRRQPQTSPATVTARPDRDSVIADRSRPLHERVAALAATGPIGDSASPTPRIGDDRPVATPMAAPRLVVQRRAASAAADRLSASSPMMRERSAQPSRARALAAVTSTVRRSSTKPVSRRADISASRVNRRTPSAPVSSRLSTASTGRDVERSMPHDTQTGTSPRPARRALTSRESSTSPSSQTPFSMMSTETSRSTETGQPMSRRVRVDQPYHSRSDSVAGRVSALAHTIAARRQQTLSHTSSAVASATVGRSVTRSLSDLSSLASTVAGGTSVRRTVNASVRSTAVHRRLAESVIDSAGTATPVSTAAATSPRMVPDRRSRRGAMPTSAASTAAHRSVQTSGESTPTRASGHAARSLGVVSVATHPASGALQRRIHSGAAGRDDTAASGSATSTAPTMVVDNVAPHVVSDRSRPLHERVAALATTASSPARSPMTPASTETYADPVRRRPAADRATGMVRSGLRLSPPTEPALDEGPPSSNPLSAPSVRLTDSGAHGDSGVATDPVSSPAMSIPVASRPVISRRIAALAQPADGIPRIDSGSTERVNNRVTTSPRSANTVMNRSAANGLSAVSRNESGHISRGPAPGTSTPIVRSPSIIADLPVRRRMDVAARTQSVVPRGTDAAGMVTAQNMRRPVTASLRLGSPASAVTQSSDASGRASSPELPTSVDAQSSAPVVSLGAAPVARRSLDMSGAIVRRARRALETSADARQVTATHDGRFSADGESRGGTAEHGLDPGAATDVQIQRSPARGFVATPTGDVVAAEVVDRNLPLSQRVAALNRRPAETSTPPSVSAAVGMAAETARHEDDAPRSAVPPTNAASTAAVATDGAVRRSAVGARRPRLTATRSPQVIQPRPMPSPRPAVVMRANSVSGEPSAAPTPPSQHDIGVPWSEPLTASMPTSASSGLVYRSSDAGRSGTSRPPSATLPDSVPSPTIRRSTARGRVVRSRSSINRRTTHATISSAPVRRSMSPTSEGTGGVPSITEHLDSIDDVMEALEDRIMRALERRGGIQRGWF